MIDQASNINIRCQPFGNTVLHIVVLSLRSNKSFTWVLQRLINAGASLTATNSKRISVVDLLVYFGSSQLALQVLDSNDHRTLNARKALVSPKNDLTKEVIKNFIRDYDHFTGKYCQTNACKKSGRRPFKRWQSQDQSKTLCIDKSYAHTLHA